MSEYLEKAKVIELIREVKSQVSENSETMIADYEDYMIESINKAQAADVKPEIHAMWKHDFILSCPALRCNHCSKGVMPSYRAYCPECGAKMDGIEGEEKP